MGRGGEGLNCTMTFKIADFALWSTSKGNWSITDSKVSLLFLSFFFFHN